MSKIAFIGGGNMAYALIKGLVNSQPDCVITVADPFPAARERYTDLNVTPTSDNEAAIAGAEAVVLAVKPQIAKQVMQTLGLQANQLLISIAAGINVASLQTWTSARQPVVRCMPNTPALVQQGATALFANATCTPAHKALATAILNAVGRCAWVEEEPLLDAVTAVSGSGPAYFFLLMESMIAAGVELGLTEQQATELTLQTAYGAAAMARQSDDRPATLRQNVTSPGGTTAAALDVMQQAQVPSTIHKALSAARQRAAELAEEFGK